MLGTDEAVVALLAAVLQVISVSGRGLAVFTFVCDPELHTTFVAESPMKWQGTLLKVKQLISLFYGRYRVSERGSQTLVLAIAS